MGVGDRRGDCVCYLDASQNQPFQRKDHQSHLTRHRQYDTFTQLCATNLSNGGLAL